MDYCSSCRRHLNGALMCPGCGAYAPDIAPPVTDVRSGSASAAVDGAAATTAVPEAPVSDTRHDRPLDHNAVMDRAPYAPAADAGDLPPARQGRAARRRQLARWKKSKRRAAVASAVALVGGGLTIAMMDRHSNDRAQAATTPDNRSMSAAEETPEQAPPGVHTAHR
ncbi:SCO2400 family protein [Streptomyces chartreusis]